MNEKNRLIQPFIMVFSVTGILLILSQLETEFKIGDIRLKKVDPISDITLKGVLRKVPLPAPVVNDSIRAHDSSSLAMRMVDSSNIYDFEHDSASALAHFFLSLNQTKKKKHKTRIAYFGDSMIEGDLISQDLRGCMQDQFGGNGVGFVPVTSVTSGFRTSIQHSFGGWTTYNLLEALPASHQLGISGYDFVPALNSAADPDAGSWVKYSGVKQKHLDRFEEVRLLYGRSASGNYVIINGKQYTLEGRATVNQLVINSPAQSITARFLCSNPIDVFGFSMESDSGAFVDNFSFRGNSGLPITKVSQAVYRGTDSCLSYDLIILEYGLNAVTAGVTDYSWYQRGMNNVIRHIQSSFPGASILLISIGDKSTRKDGIYQTDPSVPLLVEVQREMAKENKLAFWSLYDAMGGSGSMASWVEGDTAYANKDYTHFNFKGAHRVGKLLFSKLMSEYEDYNKTHKAQLP